MFERFNEPARRSLFFARALTVERDGDAITNEDLLGGVLLEARQSAARLATDASSLIPAETGEEFPGRITGDPAAWSTRAGRELSFSAGARRVIELAVLEADALGHPDIRPEHLLLGLLRGEDTHAWRRLRDAGITLAGVREVLTQSGPGEQS